MKTALSTVLALGCAAALLAGPAQASPYRPHGSRHPDPRGGRSSRPARDYRHGQYQPAPPPGGAWVYSGYYPPPPPVVYYPPPPVVYYPPPPPPPVVYCPPPPPPVRCYPPPGFTFVFRF